VIDLAAHEPLLRVMNPGAQDALDAPPI